MVSLPTPEDSMSLPPVKNFAKVTVSTGYDAAATSIVLTTGHGAKLPGTGPYRLTWWNHTLAADPADDPNAERVLVTGGYGTDTLTVTRGQDGTSASTKNTGGATYKMVEVVGKAEYDDIVSKSGDTMTGALVLSGDPDSDLKAATKRYADRRGRMFSGASGLRVKPYNPEQGDWVHGTTTYTSQPGDFLSTYNLFNGTLNNGHLISDAAQFNAVWYLIKTESAAPTVVFEYWNGSTWANLTVGVTPAWTKKGWTNLKFTIPGDWATGGSGTGVPAGNYNIRLRNTVTAVTVVGRGYVGNRLTITANEIVAGDTSLNKFAKGTFSESVNLLAAAAGGLDTGSLAASTNYAIWGIYNPTTDTWKLLGSVSYTGPTMPTDYTAKVLLHHGRTDANTVLQPWTQQGNEVFFNVPITEVTGLATTTTEYTFVSVPSVAIAVLMRMTDTAAAVRYGYGNDKWFEEGGANDTTDSLVPGYSGAASGVANQESTRTRAWVPIIQPPNFYAMADAASVNLLVYGVRLQGCLY
jgi:hypothetical protein